MISETILNIAVVLLAKRIQQEVKVSLSYTPIDMP